MASSEMLRRVALVRTDVSEVLSASIIRVTRIGELGKTLEVRSTRCNIQEDDTSHSNRREKLKSYQKKGFHRDLCLSYRVNKTTVKVCARERDMARDIQANKG
jgi:hypothetical protein